MHISLTATSAARTSPRAAHMPLGLWRGTLNKTSFSYRTSFGQCTRSARRSHRMRSTRWKSAPNIRRCVIWLLTGLQRSLRHCDWTSKNRLTTPSSSSTDFSLTTWRRRRRIWSRVLLCCKHCAAFSLLPKILKRIQMCQARESS